MLSVELPTCDLHTTAIQNPIDPYTRPYTMGLKLAARGPFAAREKIFCGPHLNIKM